MPRATPQHQSRAEKIGAAADGQQTSASEPDSQACVKHDDRAAHPGWHVAGA